MMKKISYVFLFVAMMVVASGSFVSCKDHDEDFKAETASINTVLNALRNQVSTLEGDLGVLRGNLEGLREDLEAQGEKFDKEVAQLNGLIDELKQAQKDLESDLAKANDSIENHGERLVFLELKVSSIETRIETIVSEIGDLTKRVEALEQWQGEMNQFKETMIQFKADFDSFKADFDIWKSEVNNQIYNVLPADIKDAQDAADAAMTQANINKNAIEELKKSTDEADKALQDSLDKVAAGYKAAVDSINENVAELQELVRNLGGGYATTDYVDKAINDLRTEILAKLPDYTDELNKINGNIATLTSSVAELTTKYDALLGRVEKIENYLERLISGILVQAVRNPLFGSFNFPANINSSILAGYYGDLSSASQFPTARAGYYADAGGTILSSRDLQMMGVKTKTIKMGRIASESVGTVYLTVNPTNIDFTGQTLELVNSLDEPSGVTLSPLAKSSKKLTFGWSRAASNGFYEAIATVAPENIEDVKANINLSEMKDVAKDVLTPKDGISVSGVASMIADCFVDVLDANALKASWTVDGEEMAVYSQYSIAATALKPLSYSFLQDLNVQEIPGIGRAEDFLNKMFDKVSVKLEGAIPEFDLSKYYNFLEFRELKFENVKNEITGETEIDVKANVSVEVNIPAGVYPGQEVEIWDRRDPSNPILIDKVTINPSNSEIVGGTGTATVKDTITFNVSIKEFLDGVETDFNKWVELTEKDLCDNLNELLDELNQLNDISAKVDNVVDQVSNTLIKYLDKFNAKFTKVVNSANKAIQPVMFVKTSDSFARMSQAKGSPTLVNGTDLTFVPTSYTAEIVAPPYQRLVGVTNVYNSNYSANAQAGDAACLAELQRVNAQEEVAEVLPGSKSIISVNLTKGYVYEFAYTVVDYTGLVVAQKCYVKVQ